MGKAGNVPFVWEDMPGVTKTATDQKPYSPANKLPPPPCPRSNSTRKISFQQMQDIRLPPCPFQPPQAAAPPRRTSSKKGHNDDPFLVAYRECTKSSREAGKPSKQTGAMSGLIRKHVSALSCKRSCNVRDGNLVKISHSES